MKNTTLRLILAALAVIMMFTLVSCKDEGGNSLIDTSTTSDTTPAPETTPAATTTEHVHAYKETVYPATCTTAGYTVHMCDCGDQYVDSATPLADHTYGEWTTTVAAGCTTEGTQVRTCSACGATETQKLAAAGHKYVDTIVAPTKTTQGYTVHTCSVCNSNYSDNYTNATGSVGLAYTENSDGTLTIAGIGTCTDTDVLVYSTNSDGKRVTAIAAGAFAGNTSIKSISLPESITSIGSGAFAGCTSLKSITIDANNTYYMSVGDVLFNKAGTTVVAYPAGNALTEYTISKSVTEILPSAFAGCVNLTQFKVETDNTVFSVEDGILYKKVNDTYKALVVYPAGKVTSSVTIPTNVSEICAYAFYGAKKLTTVSFNTGLATISAHAFDGCTALSAAILPNSLTTLSEYAFANCSSLSTLSIGTALTTIGAHSFERCVSLKSVKIPSTLNKIGDYSFYGCTALNQLIIGKSVNYIGENAFVLCTGLISGNSNKVNIYYEGASYQDDWCKIDIDPTNNVPLTISAKLVYYSETEKDGCWHYVNGEPTTVYTSTSTPATSEGGTTGGTTTGTTTGA